MPHATLRYTFDRSSGDQTVTYIVAGVLLAVVPVVRVSSYTQPSSNVVIRDSNIPPASEFTVAESSYDLNVLSGLEYCSRGRYYTWAEEVSSALRRPAEDDNRLYLSDDGGGNTFDNHLNPLSRPSQGHLLQSVAFVC